MRARYSLKVQLSSEPSPEDKDLGNLASEVVDDSFAEGWSGTSVLAAGATNVQLDLRTLASLKFLYIRTRAVDDLDTPSVVTISLNSTGGEAHSVLPIGEAREGHFLYTTEGVTAVYASNPGSVDMKLTLAVVGD